MIKTLCFSDLHIHAYKQHNKSEYSRLDDCLDVLSLAFETAAANECDYILFSGDLYDIQKAIPPIVINRTIARFKELFEKYEGIRFVAITGNHDQSEKSLYGQEAESAIKHLETMFPAFERIDNMRYYLGDEVYVHGIPYYEFPEHFEKALGDAKDHCLSAGEDMSVHILMMHQTPTGFEDKNMPADISVKHEYFKAFTIILNGHIHHYRRLTDSFINLGNPLHRDLGDVGEEKGFTMLTIDGTEWEEKFIPITGFPQFIEKEMGMELDEWEAEQYVIWKQPFAAAFVSSDQEEGTRAQFGSDVSERQLVENFWKEVEGTDTELLKVGLSFIQ